MENRDWQTCREAENFYLRDFVVKGHTNFFHFLNIYSTFCLQIIVLSFMATMGIPTLIIKGCLGIQPKNN